MIRIFGYVGAGNGGSGKFRLEKMLQRWYTGPVIEHWVKFEGSSIAARRRQIRVTLGDKKDFLLNGAAYESLGEPEAVELYFDVGLKRIGFKKCDPALPNAFHLVKRSRSRFHQFSAATFCNRIGIRAHTRVTFEGAYVNSDGLLVVDLKNAVIAARAK